ncbi:His/Glu/Gln/Arg/opine family amino acid ABC transporter permease subunit [Paraburkholderia sp. RAU6.4a]
MSVELLKTSFSILLQGLVTTLLLSIASIVGSTLIGLFAAVLRSFGPWGTARLARLYTELFRGTPVLITLMFIYFGVSYFGYAIDVFAAGVIGLSVYQGAYIAEIFRSGIEAVPKGQWEVSQILGLTRAQVVLVRRAASDGKDRVAASRRSVSVAHQGHVDRQHDRNVRVDAWWPGHRRPGRKARGNLRTRRPHLLRRVLPALAMGAPP